MVWSYIMLLFPIIIGFFQSESRCSYKLCVCACIEWEGPSSA